MKFEVGDKVRVINTLSEDQDNVAGGMVKLKGKILTIKRVGIDYDIEGNDWSWDEWMLEAASKFKEGDIITDGEDKKKILGVCGEVYFVSRNNEFNVASDVIYTEDDLIEDDYEVVTEDSKGVREMTVAEISKELGREIKVVK